MKFLCFINMFNFILGFGEITKKNKHGVYFYLKEGFSSQGTDGFEIDVSRIEDFENWSSVSQDVKHAGITGVFTALPYGTEWVNKK